MQIFVSKGKRNPGWDGLSKNYKKIIVQIIEY